MRNVTQADLERFCADCLARWEAYRVAQGYTHAVHDQEYTFTAGPKYARITSRRPGDPHSGSAFCFIEMATGNILKPDGWKSPARGVRGNIFEADGGASGVTVYGARALR